MNILNKIYFYVRFSFCRIGNLLVAGHRGAWRIQLCEGDAGECAGEGCQERLFQHAVLWRRAGAEHPFIKIYWRFQCL